ncbi:AraC family transcriptional regulator [Mucisphaera calidilacus]|uniref:Xylose operon regulatory protein n=1 Tax=Mucisphaera calidilacus TaxID=2527982 RepID=A0A518C0S8_9BACT|nr:DNA-binding transcriptional regulator [Mucisphaera calidilacus]QDU72826.1 Xylose operon regulatory protein [Mucisphaera calidilacus]
MEAPTIALLVETSTTWGANIIRGVNNYVRQHSRWLLNVDHRSAHDTLRLPHHWSGQGVIARVGTPALSEQINEAGLPAVNVSQARIADAGIAQVTANEATIGELAARHLQDRGLEAFGYYGPPYLDHYTDHVRPAFTAILEAAGYPVAHFDPDRYVRSADTTHDDLPRLARWIENLDKPAGILAWNTAGARRLADACRRLGYRVPEDLAIIAGDHDDLMASIADPPVSCIDHNAVQIGYQAAATLDRLMRGEDVPPVQRIEPSGIIARQSTDTLAIEDPQLASAIRFIRENAHKPIQVSDVLEVLPISRRALELRFRRALGCSPASVIRQARLERARRLLIDTRMPVSQVASGSGFQHQEVMQRAFRKYFKVTPSEYRKKHLADATEPSGRTSRTNSHVGGIRLV